MFCFPMYFCCVMFNFVQNYYLYYGTGREPLINLGFITMLSCMVAIGLAIGVTIAVGCLLIIQVIIFIATSGKN